MVASPSSRREFRLPCDGEAEAVCLDILAEGDQKLFGAVFPGILEVDRGGFGVTLSLRRPAIGGGQQVQGGGLDIGGLGRGGVEDRLAQKALGGLGEQVRAAARGRDGGVGGADGQGDGRGAGVEGVVLVVGQLGAGPAPRECFAADFANLVGQFFGGGAHRVAAAPVSEGG